MRDTDQLDTQMLGMKIVLAHVEVKNTDMYSCVTPEGQIAFVVRTLQLIHASCCALCLDSILVLQKKLSSLKSERNRTISSMIHVPFFAILSQIPFILKKICNLLFTEMSSGN